MRPRFEGRRVFVSGGGQQPGTTIGIGRAICVGLATEGAEVFVVDLHLDRAQETADAIRSTGGVAHPFAADVTGAEACETAVGTAIERMGRIDLLVNNVGSNAGDADALSLTEAAWHRVLDVNLKSQWLMCRSVIPHMRARGSGAITNIASTAGIWGSPHFFSYGIAKAGVIAMSTMLARENAAYGVRVNAVAPGVIDTPLGEQSWVDRGVTDPAEIARRQGTSVPAGRPGTAWEVANVVMFASSDDASFVTGSVIRVDGGSGTVVGTGAARNGGG